jgi:hypothetical protein
MTDISKASQDSAFQDILADVGRSRSRDERGEERFANPVAGAAFSFVGRTWPAAPVWPSVLDSFDDDEPIGPEAELPSSDDPEAIARELGLDRALSEGDLDKVRRRFMWRHHPDRCEEAQRPRADRRVAVANMLIDRARARLASRRSS